MLMIIIIRTIARSLSQSDMDLEQSFITMNVAFQSVLHYLCSQFEVNPQRREQLFQGELGLRLQLVNVTL